MLQWCVAPVHMTPGSSLASRSLILKQDLHRGFLKGFPEQMSRRDLSVIFFSRYCEHRDRGGTSKLCIINTLRQVRVALQTKKDVMR